MASDFSQQPRLTDLAARYVNEQVQAQGLGLGRQESDSEVVLFEAGPVQAIDPRPAWKEANAVLSFFARPADLAQAPSFWSQLVASQEPAVALAFCAGNYPQLMRDWHLLLNQDKLADLCPTGGASLEVSLDHWLEPIRARAKFPEAIMASGCLRLARQFDAATAMHKSLDAKVPAAWRAAWSNEAAALAWHQGRHGDALESWTKQEPAVPVLFNRGMAALFLGKNKHAEDAFLQSNAKLPETSSWYHLGQLYLTFARL